MEIRVSPTILQKFLDYETGKWDTSRKQLIDTINKVPYPQNEAMAKGSAFHELTEKPELQKLDLIKKVYPFKLWTFQKKVVDEITEYRDGGFHERRTEKILEFDGHKVMLYGLIDTIKNNLAIDVKTGKKFYGLGSYRDQVQWKIYCFAEEIPLFSYAFTDFKYCYYDDYHFTDDHLEELKDHLRRLIIFVDKNHELITHERFFDMTFDNPF